MSTWAVVLACGKDFEIGPNVDVAFLTIGPRPVLAYSLQTLQKNDSIDGIILVVKKQRVDNALQVIRSFGLRKVKSVVIGSGQRMSNLKKSTEQLPDDASVILVHDGARPFVEDHVITETVKAAKRYGASVAAIRSCEAVKLAEKGQKVTHNLERNTIWLTQSPQAFKRDVFDKILKSGGPLIDDESALLEKTRQEIHLVVSSPINMKIRTIRDIETAGLLAGSQ